MNLSAAVNRDKLFVASCLALTVTSMTFAIRAGMLEPLGIEFNLSNTELGYIASMAFLGFPVATIIGGPLCDVVGMGRLLIVAFIAHIIGIVMTIFAGGFWTLFISTFLVGFANGMVEAACNPLVATLYPEDKTTRLNKFHVWFPGGLVIGGLVSFGLNEIGLNWQWQMAAILLPTIIYGLLFFGNSFPQTERVLLGHSAMDMFKACFSPLFLFMVLCMFLTATTELGTNQWIDVLLKDAGIPGILILVVISGIMALGRYFAGGIVHRISPVGTLWVSSLLSLIGLLLLSQLHGYAALAAVVIFALGVTYFWPTMLGFVAENIPQSGALGLSLMGGSGMFAVTIFQPLLGHWYDSNLTVTGNEVDAGAATLQYVAVMPAILLVLFGGLFYMQRKKANELKSAEATI